MTPHQENKMRDHAMLCAALRSLGWWQDSHGDWRPRVKTDVRDDVWNRGVKTKRAIGMAIKLARRRVKELESLW